MIKKLSKTSLKHTKAFQEFFNSLVKEDVQIRDNETRTLGEEKEWLTQKLERVRKKKTVLLFAQDRDKVIGQVVINLGRGRDLHIGSLSIAIREGYRSQGLGAALIQQIVQLAKKELKPWPKIIQLGVYSSNPRALAFYKKQGFKQVANIPKQAEYKGRLVSRIVMQMEV